MPNRPPSVDALLTSDAFAPLILQRGRMVVRDALRQLLRRESAELGQDPVAFAQAVQELLDTSATILGTPAFNMTGVLLHSNLGRAVLDPERTAQIAREASGSVLLELDARTGKRGDRESAVAKALQALTGAEASGVVNNNASAVMLMLAALCTRSRREIIVSRGELVEIGGSFRLPEIMRASGARLVEVGTTNSTNAHDYGQAIGPKTAAILKVYPSNYKIRGYTQAASLEALARITRSTQIPLCMDLGSGCLVDMSRFGLPAEPLVQDALKQGASLVTFSGDKLLGSVQSGIILGQRQLMDLINKHPMKRALRLDKLRLALLHETLKAYQEPDTLISRLPFLRHLGRSIPALTRTATRVQQALAPKLHAGFSGKVVAHSAEAGSGSMPGIAIPSIAVKITAPSQTALKRFDQRIRRLPMPVIGRIHDGALFLDVRTLEDVERFESNLAHLNAS